MINIIRLQQAGFVIEHYHSKLGPNVVDDLDLNREELEELYFKIGQILQESDSATGTDKGDVVYG